MWAAWALGLRRGSATAELFLEGLREEPPAGTRMHLAALLAGAGEHEAVEALATGDPSSDVRGTACQYLIKTSETPNPRLAALLSERLRGEGSDVRLRILIESPGKLGPVDPEVLALCAADPDRRVRELVLGELERLPVSLASPLLEGRLPDENDPEIRRRMVEIALSAGRTNAVLDGALRSPPEQARELLRILAERGLRFEWSVMEPLAARGSPVIDSGVLGLFDELREPPAVRWLVSGIARALRLPRARTREERLDQAAPSRFADEGMRRLRAEIERWPLQDADEGDLRAILASFERDLQYFRDYAPDEYDEDFDVDAEVRELVRLSHPIRLRLGMPLLEG